MMAPDVASSQRWERLLHRLLRPFQSKHTSEGEPDQSLSDSKAKEPAKELEGLRGHRVPEYDAAIRSCSVTIQQIAEARQKVQQSDVQENYESLLWQAYQQAHGKIKEYYFSTDRRAAVFLIDRPHRDTKNLRFRITKDRRDRITKDIDLFYPLDELSKLTPEIETVLWTCLSQFQTIAELDLDFEGRDAVFFELYLIVIYLFVVIESQQSPHQMEAEQPSNTGKRSDLSQAGQGLGVLTIRHGSSGSNLAAARWRILPLRWSGGHRVVRNDPDIGLVTRERRGPAQSGGRRTPVPPG